MILSTVTLNPAIDKTCYVKNFAVNGLNRIDRVKVNMGGKGVNVAATAAKCGITCMASGFLSGYNGQMISKYLKDLGVQSDFVYTEGDTRVNIKVVDTENLTYTDINESGPEVSDGDIKALLKKVSDLAVKSDILYLGGSFPPNLEEDMYKKLVALAKEKGAKVVLDADGEALRLGVEAAPDIIKPNQAELERLTGSKIKTIQDVSRAAHSIAEKGVDTVLVTLGGNGAVAIKDGKMFRVYALNVPVLSTVGAGDSFLCGYLYGESVGADFETCLRFAMSFSAAKIQTEGTDVPDFEKLTKGHEAVTVETME